MSLDYGTAKRRPTPVGLWIGGLAVVVAIVAATHYFLDRRDKQMAAEAKAWIVTGPPCPQVTKAVFAAQPFEARQVTNLAGVRWARSSATVVCHGTDMGGGKGQIADPVCQFSSPRVLQITTAKGDFYFVPGLGNRATVSVHDGVASCVIGASVQF